MTANDRPEAPALPRDEAAAFRASNAANEFRQARLGKLEAMKRLGVNAYPYRFDRTALAAAIEQDYAGLPAGETTDVTVRICRAHSGDPQQRHVHRPARRLSGKIQVFSHKDYLPPEQLALVRLLDIGDLIGVEGLVRRTPRGELTVNAAAVVDAGQGAAAAAREVSRPHRHRAALSPALSRPDHEPAEPGDAAPAQPDRRGDARAI